MDRGDGEGDGCGGVSGLAGGSHAVLGAELGQDLEGALARGFPLFRTLRWCRWRRAGAGGFGGVELDTADVEIFFEAVGLEEVG